MAAGPLAAQGVRWSGSTSYARGSYVFDEATHTAVLSNGLTVTLGALEISGTLPILLQNSEWVSQVAGLPLPTGGREAGAVRGRGSGQTLGSGPGRNAGTGTLPEAGAEITYRDRFTVEVGDPLFSGSVPLYEGDGVLRSVRTQLSAKAPLRTVDSGVGTGEWDFGIGGSAFAAAGGTFFFVDVGRWWFGDLPDLELRDGVTYGAGVSRALFDARGSLMLSFFGATSLIESMDRPASLALGLSHGAGPGRTVSGGVAVGLSESSPDVSAYLGWSLTLK